MCLVENAQHEKIFAYIQQRVCANKAARQLFCSSLLFCFRELSRFLEISVRDPQKILHVSKLETRSSKLVNRNSKLEPRNSILENFEDRESSFEWRLSTYIWALLYPSVIFCVLVCYMVKISPHLHLVSSYLQLWPLIGDLTRETFHRPHSLRDGDI